jgi:hypothetical protein
MDSKPFGDLSMNKHLLSVILVLVFGISVFLTSTACKKTGPASPYDLAFSPTPTPIIHITGSVNVAVQDKSQAVTGLMVLAIPPSGAATYSAATTTTGIAAFNPPYLEVGNWTFVIPAQTPYPYAPSTITMPVSVANEQANFNSAGPTIQMTPPVPNAYSSSNGGVFVYGLSYSQAGNLLVPVKLQISSLPPNWSGAPGPVTVGFTNNDAANVTITGVSCVDQSPSFSVTGLDFEPTPFPRGSSAPQTITRIFSSNVTVSWKTTSINHISYCNLVYDIQGTLTVSESNACRTVYASAQSPNCGCYTSNFEQFHSPNGNTTDSNCGGGSIGFGGGSYGCEIWADGAPANLSVNFTDTNGVNHSGSIQLPLNNNTTTVLSAGY